MFRLIFFALVSLTLAGCTTYDSPPIAAIVGIEDGILADPLAPLVIAFHEPIDPETLKVRILRFETDPEGELLDGIEPIFLHDPLELFDVGGRSSLDDSGMYFTMEATQTFPIGPQLAVVIEPGLADLAGNAWNIPIILKFGFEFDCGDALEATTMPSAVLFMLADVESPLNSQLQLYFDIRVDPETGQWSGQLTNADRDPAINCSPFGLSCDASEVCRTLPEPACVEPSLKAATVAEYPDFYPNHTPPVGYTFGGTGCARDVEEGRWATSNAPTDVKVQSPNITVKGITFNLEFTRGQNGLLVGGGTFTAQQVFLGVTASGTGSGSAVIVEIPPNEVPPGVPAPPALP